MHELNHLDSNNHPAMVDITQKAITHRIAKAAGSIFLTKETLELITKNEIKKGNVLITAELAGTQAAKKTWELIPLCHQILLTKIKVNTFVESNRVDVVSEVVCQGQTGVEMEALQAVSQALLTIYDMCKAVDKKMKISNIKLIEKTKSKIRN